MSNTISSVNSASDWTVDMMVIAMVHGEVLLASPAYGDDYGVFWVV